MTRTCLSCAENRHHHARGLCQRCHSRLSKAGTLDDYPPLRRGRAPEPEEDIGLPPGRWVLDPIARIQRFHPDTVIWDGGEVA